jgi:signal transduction histidine kinase
VRLSQTFGLGAGLAVVPLIAGLFFAVDRLQDLAAQSERLMLRQLTAVRLGTGVVTRLDRLTEYQRKFAVSGDSDYAAKAEEVAVAIDAEISSIGAADLGSNENAALSRFIERWRELKTRRDGLLTERANAAVGVLANDARDLLAQAHSAAVDDVAAAAATRASAWQAALTATGVALVSSVTVLVIMLRRVRRRLDDFVDATAAVARGTLSAQLPEGERDELGRIATAFNQMVTALAQLERLKSDFLSSISHELRTPLVAMVETNEALLDDVAGPLTDQQRRMITLNRGAAQRLSVMIGDLLELNVVRSGLRYRRAPTTLDAVVVDGVQELEARARDRGVGLSLGRVDRDVQLVGDHDRLLQVVQNLVENAIKYSPHGGGRIEVELRAVDGESVPAQHRTPAMHTVGLLRVDDNGPGIPAEDRERVFEKFFRRQGVSADGVGLGLAICREIILAHRGTIWIEDGRLGGAALCVALPLEAA